MAQSDIASFPENVSISQKAEEGAEKPEKIYPSTSAAWNHLTKKNPTVDLVVLGAFYGRGETEGLYRSFLMAVYDNENDEYQSIAKCMTGFTDEFLMTSTQFFENHKLPVPPSYYLFSPSQTPDVWFEPVQVWEIMFADISLSPVPKAAFGLVAEGKGLGLRFSIFIRECEDMSTENATTVEEIVDLYRRQNYNEQ